MSSATTETIAAQIAAGVKGRSTTSRGALKSFRSLTQTERERWINIAKISQSVVMEHVIFAMKTELEKLRTDGKYHYPLVNRGVIAL